MKKPLFYATLFLLSHSTAAYAATCNGKKLTQTITTPGTYIGVGDKENVVLIKSRDVTYTGGSKNDSICIANQNISSWQNEDGEPANPFAVEKSYFYGVIVKAEGGNDYIKGSNQADVIYGGSGDDTIYGGDMDDYIFGNSGNDVLYGESGYDLIQGGGSTDTIFGGGGMDTLLAGELFKFGKIHSDGLTVGYNPWFSCKATNQNDFGISSDIVDDAANLNPSSGNDIIHGDDGSEHSGQDDTIFGSNGNNELFGNGGNDVIFGFAGGDVVHGDSGDDCLSGGAGGDTLRGLNGSDVLMGNEADDVLRGGNDISYDNCYEEDAHQSSDDCDD